MDWQCIDELLQGPVGDNVAVGHLAPVQRALHEPHPVVQAAVSQAASACGVGGGYCSTRYHVPHVNLTNDAHLAAQVHRREMLCRVRTYAHTHTDTETQNHMDAQTITHSHAHSPHTHTRWQRLTRRSDHIAQCWRHASPPSKSHTRVPQAPLSPLRTRQVRRGRRLHLRR